MRGNTRDFLSVSTSGNIHNKQSQLNNPQRVTKAGFILDTWLEGFDGFIILGGGKVPPFFITEY